LAFADALLVSEALGVSVDCDDIREIVGLVELVRLIPLVESTTEYVKEYKRQMVYNCSDHTNPTNSTSLTQEILKDKMVVQKRHVERAWKIIKPCLDYAAEMITYVDIGKYVGKLRAYIQKYNGDWVGHSQTMRMTNLCKREMDEAVKTLVDREEIERKREERTRTGTRIKYVATFYKWIGKK